MGEIGIWVILVGGFWGFSQAQAPLDLEHFPAGTEAESCGQCHPQQFTQWQQSRHAQAWNNDVFQHGFEREPRRFCVHCHAPTAENSYVLRRQGGKAADEGVSCRACHVRHGKIVSAELEGSPHDAVARPELGTSRFCANCHQFNFVEETPDGPQVTDLVMQTTYDEWLSYRELGGRETCQSCHMPGGDHSFPGVHRDQPVIDALTLQCKNDQVRITNSGAGHAIPTGDVFRELGIEVQDTDHMWSPLASFRKTYAVEIKDGLARKYIAQDTRLQAGQTARLYIPANTLAIRLRLQYAPGKSKVLAIFQVSEEGNCEREKD